MNRKNEMQGLLKPSVFKYEHLRTSPSKKLVFVILGTISIWSVYVSNPVIFKNSTRVLNSANQGDVCIFPKVDVFDPEIMKFYKNPPVCKGEFRNVTVLHHGKLITVKPDEHDCWGRCHAFKNGNETFAGEWHHSNQSYNFLCDIIEARCSPKNKCITSANYFFMHTQLLEVSSMKPTKTHEGKQYDVYFIVIDSQSHTQLYRNLNKTNSFLLNEMEAVNFPYVNRIGGGSAPNGFAWFYGKMIERVDRSPYNMPSLELAPEWKDYCKRDLSNETMIINEFRDYGYMTIHVADWFRTVDYGCVGTDDQFAHHTYTPYAMHYEYNRKMINYMGKIQCIPRHQHALEYLGQFVDSYKDKPKMAFVWLSHVGHNTERGSIDADQHLLDLFKNHKEKFDNSFVFLGGDHGLRFTNAINTKVGALDINNPALVMSVPKELRRNNELMATLKKNAGQLQTHYDTRATILDILKMENMEIPFYDNSQNQELVGLYRYRFGIQTVNLINVHLSKTNVTEKCRKWIFKEMKELVQLSETPTLQYQGLLLVSNDRSLQATFKVFLGGRDKSSLEIHSVTRVDTYKNAGDCVLRSLRHLCDCY